MTAKARRHLTTRPHFPRAHVPRTHAARIRRLACLSLGLAMLGALSTLALTQPVAAQSTSAQTNSAQTSTSQSTRITRTAPPVAATARQGTSLDLPATPDPTTATAPATAPSAAAATAAAPAPAVPAGEPAPNGRVESGLLECKGEMATAYGFGSSRGVTCEYRPAMGMNQYYTGTLSRVGLDFGVSDQASMIWMVLTTTKQLGPGALAGDYVGFTSGAAIGPGFSANVLVAKDATAGIALQPLSVSSDSGLSISIAAAGLTLTATKAQRH